MGARALLAQAVKAEVLAFLATHADLRDEQGRHMIVLNEHHPERAMQTGIGGILVRGRRVRDQQKIPKANRNKEPCGCLSRAIALTIMFKLGCCAEKTWQRLRGDHRLIEMLEGMTFIDGEPDTRKAA